MRLQTVVVIVGVLASASHSASAQTVDACGNCVSSAAVATCDSGLFTQQSMAATTRTIPVAAQLISSRVVATGVAPVMSSSSFSTFGATAVPAGGQFLNNSAGWAPSPQPFRFAAATGSVGFVPTVGVPATLSFPATSSTLTLSAPQVLATPSLAVASPGVATFLANRIASENSLSCAASVQSTATTCCSAKSLQSLEDRINALDAILAKLEKSTRAPSGGGSKDELDDLLGEASDDQPTPTPVKRRNRRSAAGHN